MSTNKDRTEDAKTQENRCKSRFSNGIRRGRDSNPCYRFKPVDRFSKPCEKNYNHFSANSLRDVGASKTQPMPEKSGGEE